MFEFLKLVKKSIRDAFEKAKHGGKKAKGGKGAKVEEKV
jgi:hypothetical protein